MTVFWCIGQLLISLLAWPLIANFSCSSDDDVCARRDNMGWRYLLFTLGGLTILLWTARFFVFSLLESPRFLVGMGRDAEAVDVIHRIAKYNGSTSNLSIDQLSAIEKVPEEEVAEHQHRSPKRLLSDSFLLSGKHIKELFRTKKMAFSTSLLMVLWGMHSIRREILF